MSADSAREQKRDENKEESDQHTHQNILNTHINVSSTCRLHAFDVACWNSDPVDFDALSPPLPDHAPSSESGAPRRMPHLPLVLPEVVVFGRLRLHTG